MSKLLLIPFLLGLSSAPSLGAECPPYPPTCTSFQEVVVGVSNEGPIAKDPIWAMLFQQNLDSLTSRVHLERQVRLLIPAQSSNPSTFRNALLDLRNQCIKVKGLLIDGHGYPGRQETAGEINIGTLHDYFDDVHCVLAPQATVHFSGCNAAEGCVGWHLLTLAGSTLLPQGGQVIGATVRRVPTFVAGHTDFGFNKVIQFNSNGGVSRLQNDWPVVGEVAPEQSCDRRLQDIQSDVYAGSGIPQACSLGPFSRCLPASIRDRCNTQLGYLETDLRRATEAQARLNHRYHGLNAPFEDTPLHWAAAQKIDELEGTFAAFKRMDCYRAIHAIPDTDPVCLTTQIQACLRAQPQAPACHP
jgi:hypothetical protein